jgi:hypothetical protein
MVILVRAPRSPLPTHLHRAVPLPTAPHMCNFFTALRKTPPTPSYTKRGRKARTRSENSCTYVHLFCDSYSTTRRAFFRGCARSAEIPRSLSVPPTRAHTRTTETGDDFTSLVSSPAPRTGAEGAFPLPLREATSAGWTPERGLPAEWVRFAACPPAGLPVKRLAGHVSAGCGRG